MSHHAVGAILEKEEVSKYTVVVLGKVLSAHIRKTNSKRSH